jgi:CheY-like chemotaxis protein
LAEDNLANILTIADCLEDHGYEVVVAHDGLEAMEKAEAIQPDIILMDIQMRGDGWLRSHSSKSCSISLEGVRA